MAFCRRARLMPTQADDAAAATHFPIWAALLSSFDGYLPVQSNQNIKPTEVYKNNRPNGSLGESMWVWVPVWCEHWVWLLTLQMIGGGSGFNEQQKSV